MARPSLNHEAGPALQPPVLGERIVFECEACDHEADATYKRDRDGVARWMIGSHVDRCLRGRECLANVAAWLSDVMNVDVRPADLLDDPRPYLATLDLRAGPTPMRIESPRSDEEWRELRRDLLLARRAANARRYVRSRGIDPRQHDLGFTIRRGYEAIIARCCVGGEVVTEAFRWYGRRPPERDQDDLLSLDPAIQSRTGWIGAPVPSRGLVVLTAGFFDGFSGRQLGLPTVSTVGTSLPDHLLANIAGRRVAVTYDVGEDDAAERTAEKINAAGGTAWVVRLAKLKRLELPPKGDLNDALRLGITRDELCELIKRERRAA